MSTKLRNIILIVLAALGVLVLTTQPVNTPPTIPTPYPTIIPNATPTNTPIPIPVGNLFNNPDFENGFEHKTELNSFGNLIQVAEFYAPIDWNIAYCYTSYMPELCNAPDAVANGSNPIGLKMRRPEFAQGNLGQKGPNYPTGERVYSGEYSAQWFCNWGVCAAGLNQTVPTVIGQKYMVTAYFQSWCNQDLNLASKRDNNCWVQIRVDLTGNTNSAFLEQPVDPIPTLPLDSNEHPVYVQQVLDNWHKITYTFQANNDQTTIYFLGYNTWPYQNNNWWLDYVSIEAID